MDRPFPPVNLCFRSERESGGLTVQPGPEVWSWLQTEILADTGSIHNPEHAHLIDANVQVLWASASFVKQGHIHIADLFGRLLE